MSTVAIPPRPEPPVAVAVSACLMGDEVRFDAAHKKSSLCHDRLEGLFTYRKVCPEVAVGMSIPRDPIRLVGEPERPRAVGVKDASVDMTEALRGYGERMSGELAGIAGYLLMKGSPSCGMERVKVYADTGHPAGHGRGIYADAIMRGDPCLPVEESGRMNDPLLRENWVTRVFVYAHWQALVADGLTRGKLTTFHGRYKYLLMAHSQPAYQVLGRLLGGFGGKQRGRDLADVAAEYIEGLMAGLSKPARRKGHANVLMHLQGYVKEHLDSDQRQELAELVHAYRRGEVPLLVPVTMLQHHLRRFPDDYALSQVYLEPHPRAQGLRNPL